MAASRPCGNNAFPLCLSRRDACFDPAWWRHSSSMRPSYTARLWGEGKSDRPSSHGARDYFVALALGAKLLGDYRGRVVVMEKGGGP